MEDSIKLDKILKLFKKKSGFIFTFMLIAMIAAAAFSYYAIVPVYEVSTQILVNQESRGMDGREQRDIELDLNMIDTYRDIIKSTVILEKVIDRVDLAATPESLFNQVTIRTNNNSQVVNIYVQDADPQQAVAIANAITEIFQSEIQSLMNTNNVNILSPAEARAGLQPINFNPVMNILLAGFVSFLFGTALAFLLEYLDQSIKNTEEAEAILGVPVLGVISSFEIEQEHEKALQPAYKRREV